MTLFGENLIPDEGLDNEAAWFLTVTPPNIITYSNSIAEFIRTAGENQWITCNPAVQPVIGAEYELAMLAEFDQGALSFSLGGQGGAVSQDGITRIRVTATTEAQFAVTCSSPTIARVEWVSLRRVGMAGAFSIDMIDRDDDSRQFTLPTTTITAANHDAQVALHTALVAGIEGISRLVTRKWDVVAQRNETGDPRPTAGSAQVNIEWQVTYVEDTTLEVRTVRIGGANLDISGILLPGSNVADLTETAMAAFVAAFEAAVLGPNGNAVTVQQVAFLE